MHNLFNSSVQITIKQEGDNCEYKGDGYVTSIDVECPTVDITCIGEQPRRIVSGLRSIKISLTLNSFDIVSDEISDEITFKKTLIDRLMRKIDDG